MRCKVLVTLFLLLFTISACVQPPAETSPPPLPSPTPAPAPTETPTPTTPTPAPTPMPTPPPTPPPPATFQITKLSLTPIEAKPGEKVTIIAEVSNTGGTEGSYTVELKVNNTPAAKETVTVAAGASKMVAFTLSRDTPGFYKITVDGLSKEFVVVKPPIQVQFLGHAGFRISDNSTVLVVDPALGLYPSGTVSSTSKVNLILLTHEHNDHMDIPTLKTIVANTGAKIAGPGSVFNALVADKLFEGKLVKFNRGQSLTEGAFQITAIPSGGIQGFLIETSAGAIFLAGDEFGWDYGAVEAVQAKTKVLDVALLPVGSPGLYPQYLSAFRSFVAAVKPKVVVATHLATQLGFKSTDHEPYASEVLAYGGVYKVPKWSQNFPLPVTAEELAPAEIKIKGKNIIMDGIADECPPEAAMISDPSGDVSSEAKDKKGVDFKAIRAFMDENYLYVAIQIYDAFDESATTNYFMAVDFDNDRRDELHFGVRPNGDTWVFDHRRDKNNWNAESTRGVFTAAKQDTIELVISKKDYQIPSSILIYSRVTDGRATVDETKWFQVP